MCIVPNGLYSALCTHDSWVQRYAVFKDRRILAGQISNYSSSDSPFQGLFEKASRSPQPPIWSMRDFAGQNGSEKHLDGCSHPGGSGMASRNTHFDTFVVPNGPFSGFGGLLEA